MDKDRCERKYGEVRTVPKEEYSNYLSSYTKRYNYLRQNGWERDTGGKWRDPRNCEDKYQMRNAVQAQRVRDIQAGLIPEDFK